MKYLGVKIYENLINWMERSNPRYCNKVKQQMHCSIKLEIIFTKSDENLINWMEMSNLWCCNKVKQQMHCSIELEIMFTKSKTRSFNIVGIWIKSYLWGSLMSKIM